ncbi:hypothetical protein C8R47DRAFT_1019615 [Mycena vitilis]|nr:hypothetical protein C8R47DRAFT_1019615 [Mycena vitilis]
MALPSYVSERFNLVDRNTPDEREWYGSINTLLGYLFPPQHYEVAPQCKGPVYPGSTDFTTIYVVRFTQAHIKHPVCFVEMKPANDIHQLSARAAADQQMRERFRDLVEDLIIPKLIGFSFLGSRYAVYEYDRVSRILTPPAIPANPSSIDDTAPAVRWADDFLDADDGEAKLLKVVQSIRHLCEGAK